MVTTKHLPLIDIQKRKKSKHTITKNHQITRKMAKEEERNKELQNSQKTIGKKAM
jgi:hypothetical protein